MVAVLRNHLTRLLQEIFLERGGLRQPVDRRFLAPDEKAQVVAKIHHARTLRIVREPHGIRPEFLDELKVTHILLGRRRPTMRADVLMTIHATELATDAVQVESVRTKLDRAEPDVQIDCIPARNLHANRIKNRFFRTPQSAISKHEFLSQNRNRPPPITFTPNPHRRHHRTVRIHVQHDAVRPVGDGVDADLRRLDPRDIAVDAAHQRVVGAERRELGIVPIVGDNLHRVAGRL